MMIRSWFPYFHVCDKAVAATWHGDDVVMGTGRFPKDPAQRRDVLGKIIFFNDGIGPNRFNEALLIEHGVVMFDHIEERLKNPRRQRDWCISAPQKAFRRIQVKIAELVNVRRRSAHCRFHKISEKFSRPLRTFRIVRRKADHTKRA